MKYFVYVLRSKKDNGWYIGSTKCIEDRLKNHNMGRVSSTKNRRPLVLLFSEKYQDRSTALSAERYYKSGAGRKKLKNILNSKY